MPAPRSADSLNDLSSKVLAGAVAVHRALGPGLLETAYAACLEHELRAMDLEVARQVPIPLIYRGMRMRCAYRADLIVEQAMLLEVKAIDVLSPLHAQQLYTYLRLVDYRLGLLLNFGAPTLRQGIKRVVNNFPER